MQVVNVGTYSVVSETQAVILNACREDLGVQAVNIDAFSVVSRMQAVILDPCHEDSEWQACVWMVKHNYKFFYKCGITGTESNSLASHHSHEPQDQRGDLLSLHQLQVL